MIFRRLHVEGFGVWRDLTLDSLHDGLNVLVAPNEGGKTTLMSFVRAVLFGFEQRGRPDRYEPLRGGKHGGWIDAEIDGHAYRFARTDDGSSAGHLQIQDPEGKRLPERRLEELLRGTTKELHRNVFAFGLAELQKIETLQGRDVADHIYSAGMAGSSVNPIEFRDHIDKQKAELFLQRGRKQKIPRLFDDIRELTREIGGRQSLPEEHAQLLRERRRLRARLDELDGILSDKQKELDDGRRAQSAWRDYEDLLAAESQLEALGVPLELAGGRPQSEALGAEGRSAVADPTDLLSRPQRSLLREAGRIRSLLAAAPRMRELRATVQKHRDEADAAEAALGSHLKDLGEGWDAGRIQETSTGHAEREEARRFAEEMRKAEAEIEAIKARAQDANEDYEKVVARRERITREVVMLTVTVGAALTYLSTLVVGEVAVVAVTGALAGATAVAFLVLSWVRWRERRDREADRVTAAQKETELWNDQASAENELEKTRKRWRAWLRERLLGPDLTIDGALDMLDRVREAQEVHRRRSEAAEAAERAAAELRVAAGRVNALLESLGRDVVSFDDGLLAAVEPLLGQLESLQADLESAEDHRIRLRTIMDQYAQARAALRAVAGGEGPDALRARLESLDPDRISRQVEDAGREVEAIRIRRDRASEHLGGVNERIRHIEEDAALADLLLEREERRAELADAIREWASWAIAGALFDQAKHVYEEQRQPEVLQLASRYFEAMTRGVYSQVMAPLGESRLEVEEKHGGRRKGPEALSRGTSEQLYLAMRLALASVYARQAVMLPLVADDILVNFDDQRAAATATLLGRYAEEGNQILAFTCHVHLADVFARQATGVRIQRLPTPP